MVVLTIIANIIEYAIFNVTCPPFVFAIVVVWAIAFVLLLAGRVRWGSNSWNPNEHHNHTNTICSDLLWHTKQYRRSARRTSLPLRMGVYAPQFDDNLLLCDSAEATISASLSEEL